MKKWDLKRQEIIRTAEYLFTRFGYEATSVQDILDELHTSKGSFYHHFVSKEALLKEICRIHAKSGAENMAADSGVNDSTLDKLNHLLSGMIPFSGEKISFLMMILPVFDQPEGTSLRTFYEQELTDTYFEQAAMLLASGTEEGVFSCSRSDFFAEIILRLSNRLWLKVCDYMLACEKDNSDIDYSELMNVVSQYRLAVERLLCAPFGSIELITMSHLRFVSDQIHQHWKQP